MASHHKVYELVNQAREDKRRPACSYDSSTDVSRYSLLLDALQPYGSLGNINGPTIAKKRVEMDILYYEVCKSPSTHMAWLADAARAVLNPQSLRKVVDVIHFQWSGDVGDVEYCP